MPKFHEMPQATPTMTTGLIVAWLKNEGDDLAPQDAIAEVETDKAAQEIEVFDPCVLLKILVPAGEEVAAGQPIAIIGDAVGEDISELMATYESRKEEALAALSENAESGEPTDDAPAVDSAPTVTPSPPPPAAQLEAGEGYTHGSWAGHTLHEAIMEPSGPYAPAQPVVRASPIARKVAIERGVALTSVRGSGPNGRIVRADVETAMSGGVASGPPRADQSVRNSQMRKAIARRLLASHQDAPSFFLTARFDCDRFVDLRNQLKAGGLKASYNDLLLRAVAKALADVPEVNASWSEDSITRFGRVDVGIAVALPDGLITPIIRNADRKSVAQIAQESRDLVERAKSGALDAEEYTGSTFTVSNLGMMQIEDFTAIINPPEAAILAVGALQQEAIVVPDGTLAVSWQMKVTMTCDHRVIDGALGARFLQSLRAYVERPALLLV
jgi:pyruvate dehydrogenase E2 component (dihydrolipoamide acetyltransferase)